MKRSNAAVRIPPNPPKSTNTSFKPVQIGAPTAGTPTSSGPPVKPKRGVTKSDTQTTSQFFYPQETLSDVQITFSKPDSGEKQTLEPLDEWKQPVKETIPSENLIPGDKSDAQPFYENIPRQSGIGAEAVNDSGNVFEWSTTAKSAEFQDEVNIRPAHEQNQPGSETSFSPSGHAKLRQCDTFDNLQVGPISSPFYENINRRTGTYLIPDELLDTEHARNESPLPTTPTSSGFIDHVSVEVEPPPARTSDTKEPGSTVNSSVSSTRPPLRPPVSTIYKDPVSLFDSTQLDRLSVSGLQLQAPCKSDRSKSTSHLSDSSGSRATTIQDSGSEISSVEDSGSGRTASFEDFVVLRRNQAGDRGGRGGRQRAVSEIITTRDPFKNSMRESGWFEALKQSLFGGNYPISSDADNPPKSTFYIDKGDDDDDDLYSSLDLPEPISSRVRKTLPESMVTNLTPAVFEIPQPNPSVFYTDQEEHIYCSSETLGSMSFPGLSVQNKGYRDPHMRAAEQQEQSIPVRTARCTSQGSVLSTDTYCSIPDVAGETEGLASTGTDDIESSKSGTVVRRTEAVLNSKSDVGVSSTSGTVLTKTEGDVPKRKVSRVSMMKQKFENPNLEESSSKEQTVVLRDKSDAGRHARKQIVSLQFSSNVLEIDHKENSTGSGEK